MTGWWFYRANTKDVSFLHTLKTHKLSQVCKQVVTSLFTQYNIVNLNNPWRKHKINHEREGVCIFDTKLYVQFSHQISLICFKLLKNTNVLISSHNKPFTFAFGSYLPNMHLPNLWFSIKCFFFRGGGGQLTYPHCLPDSCAHVLLEFVYPIQHCHSCCKE